MQWLRDERMYAVGDWTAGGALKGFSAPTKLLGQTNKNRADHKKRF
jgi:hypothetical protein